MSDPICPFAKQRLLARAASKPTIRPTATAAHTAVTGANGQQLGDFFEHADADAHFYVDHDGTLWQYLPVDRKSWAQYSGNDHVIAYETWDGGNPATPWNPAQIASIVRLLCWLNRSWDISLDDTTGPTAPGAAFHSKYADWNRDSHACPGATRVGQLEQEVLPAARRAVYMPTPHPSEEDDMAITPPIKVTVKAHELRGFSTVDGVKLDTVRGHVARVEHEGAMKGVVPEFGIDWGADPAGDAIVWGQLATPPLVDVDLHVQITHVA